MLSTEWESFRDQKVPKNASLETLRLAHWAFYSGAQAMLVLTAEELGKFRDEINEMRPIQEL